MVMNESIPEKRNLMIFSLIIIVFIFSGGEFLDNTIKISPFNIKLDNSKFLAIMLWLVFIYINYRFYVKCTPIFFENYHSDLLDAINDKNLHNFVVDKVGGPKVKLVDKNVKGQIVPTRMLPIYEALRYENLLIRKKKREAPENVSLIEVGSDIKVVRRINGKEIDEIIGFDISPMSKKILSPSLFSYKIKLPINNWIYDWGSIKEINQDNLVEIELSKKESRRLIRYLVVNRSSLSDYYAPLFLSIIAGISLMVVSVF
ncbi:MAG: Unknown protein [uncultured Sulfurovum sp.]|uniref:Uncharacterized protein n=1 Tax=uncultured Sulfurovum sp. TaxID=269237 RepID=A0A6S6TBN6_9BACT|nr:MAG: Unknown protein [uncultured Sulfurovum sp.]